ncbi:FCD domain-containing protein [Niveispirillum sp. BGYR6]|uniref:FCD domain-containing protein n=1 Tax=Niveispirillum sp. BGYR6 TaxID=2971249 RepID=UPI0022B97327|nr:FCD domain-containing protein [Niveispirillum sp. BGYR6]MDG5496212.1 FCD domain-containing protein [Niveispirillum sp. BGYR6]
MPPLTDQIKALISARQLAPGARLPPERTLAAELGVSRSRLREAMQQLISRGLIVSRRGGGNFVAPGSAELALEQAMQPLQPLAQTEGGYWQDVMEIRKSLEADAAYHAALRADDLDRQRLTAALLAVCAGAADPDTQSRADAAFHMAIAEASHNLVLRQVISGLFDLMRVSIAESLSKLHLLPDTAEKLNHQHQAIAAAILAGRADEARQAATDHLCFVEDSLRRIEEETARARRAGALRNKPSQGEMSA